LILAEEKNLDAMTARPGAVIENETLNDFEIKREKICLIKLFCSQTHNFVSVFPSCF